MIHRTSDYKILVSVILVIFLVSTLTGILDEENFACTSTLQISSYNIDDNSSPDKKKNFCASIPQRVLPCVPSKVLIHVSVVHTSCIISHIIFPYFLRAPPIA
jgi:L-cystine uptake protein TcyP (sodium:dicarboxylate symporter family)